MAEAEEQRTEHLFTTERGKRAVTVKAERGVRREEKSREEEGPVEAAAGHVRR